MNQSQKNVKQKQQGKKPRTAITPTRDEDFAQWYQEVVKATDMAETSPTRGCMIIKPYGWAIWEKCQEIFDKWLKDYGVQNASFPLLIPMSFFSREAEHVDGFAKECAVVTHHRLESDGEGGLQPADSAKLEEPYVVRPTSETIIGDAMSRWVQSYRDLPLQLNQWAQVLRWEMRTRLFLRTAEFFWHEGHNAFADHEGADNDCRHVMGLYEKFFNEYLAFDGFVGVKTPEETFPGADRTYAFEAMMQDGKALQAATTHDLGTTFAKTFNITYQGKDEQEHLCHTTSWAFSTRTIGGLIMMHADDDGMIMPPRIAPQQIIILPVTKDDNADAVEGFCQKIATDLKKKGFRVKLDSRDLRTPDKMWDAVKKGVPIRVEVGGREMEAGQLTYVRRDIGRDSKTTLSVEDFVDQAESILDDIHDTMLERTRKFRDEHTHDVATVKEIDDLFKAGEIGFCKAPVAILKDAELEKVMGEHGLSARNMPNIYDGEKVLISKAY